LQVEQIRLITNFLTNGHLKMKPVLNLIPRALVEMIEGVTVRLPGPLRRRVHASMAVLFKRPA